MIKIIGDRIIPRIDMPIEMIIVSFFNFLFDTLLASCGIRYLKMILENAIKIV